MATTHPSPNDASLPEGALLQPYRDRGAFTDCHALDLPRSVSHAAFVEAFFTTPIFGIERRLLAVFAGRPSTPEGARVLASGAADDRPFAAWSVEARADRQLLLKDFTGRTRTWLMTAPTPDGGTRLYLGSAVLPAGTGADGRPRMGAAFRVLLGFHIAYSKALLAAARRRLMRDRVGQAPSGAPTAPSTSAPAVDAPAARPPVTEPGAAAPRIIAAPAASASPSRPPGAGQRPRRGPPWRERPTPEQIAGMPPFEALRTDRIVLIETPAQAEAALRAIREARVIGFDTESKPTFTRDAVRDGPHVIQFATLEAGFVVQVNDRTPIDLLRAVLDTEDVVKVGFGLDSDRGPLEQKFGLRLRGTVDLSQRLRGLGFKDALGAKVAVAVVLGRRLQKSKRVQTSNWGAPTLTAQQIAYAANDAYAALKVHDALENPRA